MAYDYNKAKQAWEMMDDNQKKQYTEQNKNDANFQQFAQQYHNEMNSNGNSSSNGSVKQNNTVNNTQGTNTQPTTQSNQNQTNQNGTTYDFSNNHSTLSDGRNGNGNFYGNTQFDREEQFDKSMIGDTKGVTIQEGTGKDTGRPDYQIDTDARLNEMRNNLNQYYQTNPERFQDRETFNRQFEYNQRESDAQRALLDSYWKKAQDMRTVNNYTNGDSVMAGFNNYDITPDQMSLLRQYNPDAYAQWQKQMQDELNARITNLAAPRDVWSTVDLWGEIVKKFGLEAGDPYDIYGTWYNMADQLGVFRDSQQLESMSNNIASIYSTMNSNVQSISSQLEGRYSAGYIEARINKANSRLNSQASSMQYSYNLLLQKRNQNMAIAQQAGAMKQAQGQEDSRVFNNKLRALNFAMTADSYRTPEQQQQLLLQTEQIRNDMSLLNQSKLNDLSLYNQYATAKMQNQLNYEMQDLTVTDPKQLRANLSNVLDQWYSQYGDIIKRSKSEVIEDVLAYAKNNGVSVGEALRQEFVKKLMGKDEYKKLMNNKLGIKEDTYNYTIDENGNIKITGTGTGSPDLESLRRIGGSGAGTMRTERNNNPTAMTSDVAKSLGGVEGVDYIVGDAFPNNPNLHTAYLLGDPIETTIKLLDNAASTGRGAFYTKGGKQRWTHTAMSDSAWLALTDEEKKNVVLKMLKNEGGDINKMAYYNNGQGNSNGIGDSFEWKNSTYDLSKYSERNGLNDTEKELVKGLLSYTIDPNSLPKSGSENGKTNAKVRAAASVIGRDTGYTEQKYKTTQTIRTNWEKSLQQGGEASRNATAMSVLKSIAESFDSLNNTDFTYVNQLVNWMKKQNGDTDVVALDADVTIAASEMAGALKGNASPTDPEISAMKDLLSGKLSYNQAMEVIKKSAKGLFDKHESEAKGYYDLFGEKPNPIWVDDVADWMANDLGINLGRYYNYDTVTAEDLRQKYFPDVKPAFNITTTNGSLDYTGAAMAVLNA